MSRFCRFDIQVVNYKPEKKNEIVNTIDYYLGEAEEKDERNKILFITGFGNITIGATDESVAKELVKEIRKVNKGNCEVDIAITDLDEPPISEFNFTAKDIV